MTRACAFGSSKVARKRVGDGPAFCGRTQASPRGPVIVAPLLYHLVGPQFPLSSRLYLSPADLMTPSVAPWSPQSATTARSCTEVLACMSVGGDGAGAAGGGQDSGGGAGGAAAQRGAAAPRHADRPHRQPGAAQGRPAVGPPPGGPAAWPARPRHYTRCPAASPPPPSQSPRGFAPQTAARWPQCKRS